MTKRTPAKEPLSTSDDDSISINSTQESEADEERSYVVDRILAEQDDDEGNKYYLIRWDGYGLLASTWEPAENIEGRAPLDDWNEEKMRLKRGLSKAFNVVAFEEEKERLRLAKEKRGERRRAKRERLGLATSFLESEEDIPLSVICSKDKHRNVEPHVTAKESEAPIKYAAEHSGSKSKLTISKNASDTDDGASRNTITAKVKRRTINLPIQGHVTDSSEDSSVEEPEWGPTKARPRDKKFRTAASRKARDAPSLPSDEVSSLSRSASPLEVPQNLTQKKPKTRGISRTGYRGTANRRAGAMTTIPPSHESPLSRGATRGRPRGRGRGRGRGNAPSQGHELAENFSFITPNNEDGRPKRKRSLADAILNAPTVDSGKPIEHFKTPSMVRKAELAARSLADRAPDMRSVGLLSKPSDYGGSRSIRKRPQILREDSEISPNNDDGSTFIEGGSNSMISSDIDEEKTLLTRTDSQTQSEITERTAKIDLYKTRTPTQTTVGADRGSQNISEVGSTGLSALPQEQSDFAVKESKVSEFHDTGSIPQSFQLEDNNSPLAESQIALSPSGDRPSQPLKTISKMNLAEYKSRRKSEFLGDAVPAQATFGSQGTPPMHIGFTDIDKAHRLLWIPMLSDIGVLNFNRTCIAQEFKTQLMFLQSKVHLTGNIISGAEGATYLDELAEWLRPFSGLIFIHDVFCILIFPARCEEWNFLDSSSDIAHRIRYQIYEPKTPKSTIDNALAETAGSSLDINRHYLDVLVELTQNLQYQALIPPHPEGRDAQNFYLFFPKRAVPSARYFIAWLRACNGDCRIFTNQKSGSWDLFSNNLLFKSGTIIIHGMLLPSIFKIPRLARLIYGRASFNFWCIDDGSCANPFRFDFGSSDAMPSCEASMIRLFPHGGAVFLTPSFLITQPERTYDLLKWFQKKLSSSTQGTWRLVLPHAGLGYLLDLAVEKASAREKLYTTSLAEKNQDNLDRVAASQFMSHQECKARFQSYFVLEQLLKAEYMAGIMEYWGEDSPDEFESPIIYADESVDVNDEKALVTWFAGWTMLNLHLFRKFMVVGTTPLKTRTNAPRANSTGAEKAAEKGHIPTTVQKHQIPKIIDPQIAASKWRNRDAFSAVKDAPPPVGTTPFKANEPSNGQNPKRISHSENLSINPDNGGAAYRASAAQHIKLGNSETIPRDSPQGSRKRHGIDENQPPEILEFIAITGTEAETANRYLTRYNGDVHIAVQRYWYSTGQSSSPRRGRQTDGADDSNPTAVVDFIAGTHTTAQVAERYLHLAQDDVRRAIALYNESQQYSRSPSGGQPKYDGFEVRGDVPENDPSKRVKGHITSKSPVKERPEPEESQEEYLITLHKTASRKEREALMKNRASLNAIEEDLNANSANYVRPDSPSIFEALKKSNQVTPTVDMSSQVASSRLLVKSSGGIEKDTRVSSLPDAGAPNSPISKVFQLDPDFETTVEWYDKLRKNGQGWEHIYVGGWEACFPRLMSVKK